MNKLDRLRAMLEADPTNAFGWYSLAMELKKSDLAESLETFEKLRQNHPDYLPSYYHFGKTLEESGDLERAKQIYSEGVTLAGKTGDTHTLGELEDALAQL